MRLEEEGQSIIDASSMNPDEVYMLFTKLSSSPGIYMLVRGPKLTLLFCKGDASLSEKSEASFAQMLQRWFAEAMTKWQGMGSARSQIERLFNSEDSTTNQEADPDSGTAY